MHDKIVAENISIAFGTREILKCVNLTCFIGEILAILGRNGTGKSTLFNVMFGTFNSKNSLIYYNDQPVSCAELKSIIGFHTQQIMLPKNLSVNNLIEMYIDPSKQNNVFYAKGVHELQAKKVGKLSLGQQRYLQLLLLLNLNHKFLILDEPFSMVEPLVRTFVKELILEYKQKKGFIITDHYYLDVIEIANNVKLLKDGNLIDINSFNDLHDLNYLSANAIL
ncbi:MAG TPA: ATP-binding cassette domain-containing protein [Mucilaginibacter sp.]|jgi:ABC-type multidrug transport system ATPase subunit